jgi:hypothetical protein
MFLLQKVFMTLSNRISKCLMGYFSEANMLARAGPKRILTRCQSRAKKALSN